MTCTAERCFAPSCRTDLHARRQEVSLHRVVLLRDTARLCWRHDTSKKVATRGHRWGHRWEGERTAYSHSGRRTKLRGGGKRGGWVGTTATAARVLERWHPRSGSPPA